MAFYRDILHHRPEQMESQSPLRWLMSSEGQARLLAGPFKLDAERRRCASALWCLACVCCACLRKGLGGASATCHCPSTCLQLCDYVDPGSFFAQCRFFLEYGEVFEKLELERLLLPRTSGGGRGHSGPSGATWQGGSRDSTPKASGSGPSGSGPRGRGRGGSGAQGRRKRRRVAYSSDGSSGEEWQEEEEGEEEEAEEEEAEEEEAEEEEGLGTELSDTAGAAPAAAVVQPRPRRRGRRGATVDASCWQRRSSHAGLVLDLLAMQQALKEGKPARSASHPVSMPAGPFGDTCQTRSGVGGNGMQQRSDWRHRNLITTSHMCPLLPATCHSLQACSLSLCACIYPPPRPYSCRHPSSSNGSCSCGSTPMRSCGCLSTPRTVSGTSIAECWEAGIVHSKCCTCTRRLETGRG